MQAFGSTNKGPETQPVLQLVAYAIEYWPCMTFPTYPDVF